MLDNANSKTDTDIEALLEKFLEQHPGIHEKASLTTMADMSLLEANKPLNSLHDLLAPSDPSRRSQNFAYSDFSHSGKGPDGNKNNLLKELCKHIKDDDSVTADRIRDVLSEFIDLETQKLAISTHNKRIKVDAPIAEQTPAPTAILPEPPASLAPKSAKKTPPPRAFMPPKVRRAKDGLDRNPTYKKHIASLPPTDSLKGIIPDTELQQRAEYSLTPTPKALTTPVSISPSKLFQRVRKNLSALTSRTLKGLDIAESAIQKLTSGRFSKARSLASNAFTAATVIGLATAALSTGPNEDSHIAHLQNEFTQAVAANDTESSPVMNQTASMLPTTLLPSTLTQTAECFDNPLAAQDPLGNGCITKIDGMTPAAYEIASYIEQVKGDPSLPTIEIDIPVLKSPYRRVVSANITPQLDISGLSADFENSAIEMPTIPSISTTPIHVVEPGDVLSRIVRNDLVDRNIADRRDNEAYKALFAQYITANPGLANDPGKLSVGQVLIVPSVDTALADCSWAKGITCKVPDNNDNLLLASAL